MEKDRFAFDECKSTAFRYSDLKGGELEDCIKWCCVKSVRRAQEKVQRSYCEVRGEEAARWEGEGGREWLLFSTKIISYKFNWDK
jgi:hypothetical protein